jgi:hypothetical protein
MGSRGARACITPSPTCLPWTVLQAFGTVYSDLGRFDEALGLLSPALAMLQRLSNGRGDGDEARCMRRVATCLYNQVGGGACLFACPEMGRVCLVGLHHKGHCWPLAKGGGFRMCGIPL